MKNPYANLFKKVLTEAVNDVTPYDPTQDANAFEDSLDESTPKTALDPKLDVSKLDQPTKEVMAWIPKLDKMKKLLLDPNSPDALFSKMGALSTIPAYAEAQQNIAKAISKADEALSEVSTEIAILANLAQSRATAAPAEESPATPASPEPKKPAI